MTQTSDQFVSLPALIAHRAAVNPTATILRRKARGIWHAVTWQQLAEQVQRIGAGLHDIGLGPGDAACIIADTRPETAFADIAIQSCGAASVIVGSDTEAARIEHILRATASRAAFVEDEEQLDKILAVRDRCPALSRIIIFDIKGLREFNDPQCCSLAAFVQDSSRYDWMKAACAVSAQDRAIILYRKHDTTAPGQVMLHRDVMKQLATIHGRLGLTPRDERLALLGMADPLERVWGLYAALDSGCISNYLESTDTEIENLQELQPTILGANAELWLYLHARTTQAANIATAVQRKLYDWAIRAGLQGGLQPWAANLLVLGAVRRELGLRRLRLAYIGGERISPPVLDWMRSLGVRIEWIEASETALGEPASYHDQVMQGELVPGIRTGG